LVALANFMRLSLLALSSAAWQEIRVRSGRDDNSFFDTYIPHNGPSPFIPGETCRRQVRLLLMYKRVGCCFPLSLLY